jgi:photosynthetic reaction center cytochrome c subunit
MRVRLTLLCVLLATATGAAPDQPKENAYVSELLQSLQGKENHPAGTVFRNVKLLKDIPAARFLRLMDSGYSQALGVGCEYCHVEDRWEADEKRPKSAAREMILLTREINDKLVMMEHIDNMEPAVNCATCHRGYVKPATQMR